MSNLSPEKVAGNALRKLIKDNYSSQEDFAWDYGLELRTVSRYVNNGISKLAVVDELATFFGMTWEEFLTLGKEDN